jgi:hypothetical protein
VKDLLADVDVDNRQGHTVLDSIFGFMAASPVHGS